MITKVLQSNDLRATLDYIYQENKSPEVVESSCLDASREGAHRSIQRVIDLREDIKKPVFHAVLSVPEHEKINDHTWKKIAEEYTQKMGFGDVPYVAVRHQDTDHQHIHIVASRIQMDGKLISDSFEVYRSQEIARALERKHELTRVPSSWEIDRRRTRPEDLHRAQRLDEPVQRARMERAIASSLTKARGVDHFVEDLSKQGVRVIPNITQDGNKVQGISFEREGVKISGSKINRQYSWNRLKDTLSFEHTRDVHALTRPPEARTIPSRPSHPSPSPDPVSRTPEPVRERTGATPPQVSRTPVEPTRSPEHRPSLTPSPEHPRQGMDDTTRIKKALMEVPLDQGWTRWNEALRKRGVEAVPKVTQQNEQHVRGMYFVSGQTMMPGSQVDRQYSFAQLEKKLGTYTPERDPNAFQRVMVPGHGIKTRDMQSTPEHQNSPMSRLLSKLEGEGYHVEKNPEHAKGTWAYTVSDHRGLEHGVILKERTGTSTPSVAIVPLHSSSTRLVQAHLEQGKFTPERTLSSHEEIARGEQVVWKKDQQTQMLVRVMPHEHGHPPVEKTLSGEERLVQKFKEGGYRVELRPDTYQGHWVSQVKTSDGHIYGVIARDTHPSTKDVALVHMSRDVSVVNAQQNEGKLVPTQRAHVDNLKQGDRVMWRDDGHQSALIRITSADMSRSTQQPSPSHPTASSNVNQHPHESQSEWIARQKAQGHQVHVLAPRESMSGTLEANTLKLKEGEFHILRTRQNKLVLVPHTQDTHVQKDTRAMVRMRIDGSVDVKPLDRTKERGMER